MIVQFDTYDKAGVNACACRDACGGRRLSGTPNLVVDAAKLAS
jgi:hypothetical protein